MFELILMKSGSSSDVSFFFGAKAVERWCESIFIFFIAEIAMEVTSDNSWPSIITNSPSDGKYFIFINTNCYWLK